MRRRGRTCNVQPPPTPVLAHPEARSGAEMARIRARLPALARSLLQEKLSVLDVAAVLSAVLRDISARAAELAAEKMIDEGRGHATA